MVTGTTELPKPRNPLRRALVSAGRPAWKTGILAGVSPTVLSQISVGRRKPRSDEAERLAEVLGTSVAELFPDDEFAT